VFFVNVWSILDKVFLAVWKGCRYLGSFKTAEGAARSFNVKDAFDWPNHPNALGNIPSEPLNFAIPLKAQP
jgi:hypothetical protein